MVTLLIVEDDPTLLEVLANLFSGDKLCDTASTTEEALGRLGAGDYDVIVTDISSLLQKPLNHVQQLRRNERLFHVHIEPRPPRPLRVVVLVEAGHGDHRHVPVGGHRP